MITNGTRAPFFELKSIQMLAVVEPSRITHANCGLLTVDGFRLPAEGQKIKFVLGSWGR